MAKRFQNKVAIALSLGLMIVSFVAQADLSKAPRVEMMKCYAPENGTVWMSFGHLVRWDSDQLETFVAEVAYFPVSGNPYRKVYWKYQESLDEIQVRVREKGLAVEFQSSAEELGQIQHVIQLVKDEKSPSSYHGNWRSTGLQTGQVSNSQAGCTVH